MKLNEKICFIFLIMILVNGCKKREEIPTQIQIDSFIQEESMLHELVEYEENFQKGIIHNEATENTKVGIILKYASSINDKIVYIDRYITELEIFKTRAIGIEGLNQLEFLDTIVFSKLADLNDYSFLIEIPHLKRLFIDYQTYNINWSFIEQLRELEVLYVESYRVLDGDIYYQPEVRLDLKNNNRLEYVGFTDGILEAFPTLINVPDSLKYLNLEGNRIISLPEDFNNYSRLTVFLNMNYFKKGAKTPSNVTVEWASNILEQKYCMPTNMPHISDLN